MSSAAPGAGGEPVVHIVDDDVLARESVALTLAREGYRTAIYADAESLLDGLDRLAPGCLDRKSVV